MHLGVLAGALFPVSILRNEPRTSSASGRQPPRKEVNHLQTLRTSYFAWGCFSTFYEVHPLDNDPIPFHTFWRVCVPRGAGISLRLRIPWTATAWRLWASATPTPMTCSTASTCMAPLTDPSAPVAVVGASTRGPSRYFVAPHQLGCFRDITPRGLCCPQVS